MSELVKFDAKWEEFIGALHAQQINTYEQGCEITGITYAYLHKVIDSSIGHWRDSTSTSLLNGVANITLNKVPYGEIFSDLMWQTRFIMMAIKSKLLNRFDVDAVIDGETTVKIKGETALTSKSLIGVTIINKILRALYIYWYVNSNKKVKLPKFIYRGIRANDLYNHPNFAPAVAAIWKSDNTRDMNRKMACDILFQWICDKKLHQITDAELLSFTSSISVAKYFTNGSGFCLRVDPTKVQIITSEIHDSENIGGKDIMSGKNEREYIVKIPHGYEFKPEDIIVNDLDYFVAEMNPLSVGLFDHDDKEAQYEMKGVSIKAFFSWNGAGTSGRLLFKNKSDTKDPYGLYNRMEFKKNYGFDPLPTPDNLVDITDFKISPRKR